MKNYPEYSVLHEHRDQAGKLSHQAYPVMIKKRKGWIFDIMTKLRSWFPVVMISLLAISLLILASCGNGEPTQSTSPTTAAASSPTTTPTTTPTTSPATTPTSKPQLESYTIADSTGDWGYPSPYAHYSRGPGYIRMQFIFETLVWKNADEFIPQLAYEWSYDESENSYTFKLRENVQWHDGTAFTADDVVFTYEYTEEYPYQWVDNSIVDSIEALDDYTVKLYLSQPYAPFFQDVAGAQPVLPKHIWENVTVPEEFLTEEAVIGTGPYLFGDYNKEQGTYLYTANDNYYLGQPAVKELKFVKVAAEMNPAALNDGSVNCASIEAEVVAEMESTGFTIITDRPSWNAKMMINHQKEPFSSKEFRQALAYAIDREALVQIVLRGHGVAGSPGLMPPTSPWYNPETPQYEYDPEKAQQLLEGLGYQLENGKFTMGGQPLEVSLIAAESFKDLGQFITQQLEEVGITIDFQTFESKTIDAKVGAWEFDLSIYGHGGLYEASILERVILDDGFNSARYTTNNELTELLTAQLTEMDSAERKDMVFQIQVLYAEDVPALTLYYPTSYFAHDGSIQLYYTMDGIAVGVPVPINRMSFVNQ